MAVTQEELEKEKEKIMREMSGVTGGYSTSHQMELFESSIVEAVDTERQYIGVKRAIERGDIGLNRQRAAAIIEQFEESKKNKFETPEFMARLTLYLEDQSRANKLTQEYGGLVREVLDEHDSSSTITRFVAKELKKSIGVDIEQESVMGDLDDIENASNLTEEEYFAEQEKADIAAEQKAENFAAANYRLYDIYPTVGILETRIGDLLKLEQQIEALSKMDVALRDKGNQEKFTSLIKQRDELMKVVDDSINYHRGQNAAETDAMLGRVENTHGADIDAMIAGAPSNKNSQIAFANQIRNSINAVRQNQAVVDGIGSGATPLPNPAPQTEEDRKRNMTLLEHLQGKGFSLHGQNAAHSGPFTTDINRPITTTHLSPPDVNSRLAEISQKYGGVNYDVFKIRTNIHPVSQDVDPKKADWKKTELETKGREFVATTGFGGQPTCDLFKILQGYQQIGERGMEVLTRAARANTKLDPNSPEGKFASISGRIYKELTPDEQVAFKNLVILGSVKKAIKHSPDIPSQEMREEVMALVDELITHQTEHIGEKLAGKVHIGDIVDFRNLLSERVFIPQMNANYTPFVNQEGERTPRFDEEVKKLENNPRWEADMKLFKADEKSLSPEDAARKKKMGLDRATYMRCVREILTKPHPEFKEQAFAKIRSAYINGLLDPLSNQEKAEMQLLAGPDGWAEMQMEKGIKLGKTSSLQEDLVGTDSVEARLKAATDVAQAAGDNMEFNTPEVPAAAGGRPGLSAEEMAAIREDYVTGKMDHIDEENVILSMDQLFGSEEFDKMQQEYMLHKQEAQRIAELESMNTVPIENPGAQTMVATGDELTPQDQIDTILRSHAAQIGHLNKRLQGIAAIDGMKLRALQTGEFTDSEIKAAMNQFRKDFKIPKGDPDPTVQDYVNQRDKIGATTQGKIDGVAGLTDDQREAANKKMQEGHGYRTGNRRRNDRDFQNAVDQAEQLKLLQSKQQASKSQRENEAEKLIRQQNERRMLAEQEAAKKAAEETKEKMTSGPKFATDKDGKEYQLIDCAVKKEADGYSFKAGGGPAMKMSKEELGEFLEETLQKGLFPISSEDYDAIKQRLDSGEDFTFDRYSGKLQEQNEDQIRREENVVAAEEVQGVDIGSNLEQAFFMGSGLSEGSGEQFRNELRDEIKKALESENVDLEQLAKIVSMTEKSKLNESWYNKLSDLADMPGVKNMSPENAELFNQKLEEQRKLLEQQELERAKAAAEAARNQNQEVA